METPELDLDSLHRLLDEYQAQSGALILILQKAQAIYGWLPREVLETIARRMQVSLSQIYGVATFYSQFYLERRGRHIVRQCDGTACHVRGAAHIVDAARDVLGIDAGETTSDFKYTYEVVYCLGSCGLCPAAMVDDRIVGHLTPQKMTEILETLE